MVVRWVASMADRSAVATVGWMAFSSAVCLVVRSAADWADLSVAEMAVL